MTMKSERKSKSKARRSRAKSNSPLAKKAEPNDEIGFGTRVAAMFAECGLDEPIPELHGYYIEPMKFEL